MRRKSLALLLVLSMLATMFVGVMPASAADYSVSSVTKVSSGDSIDLGRMKVAIEISELSDGDFLVLRLPTDFEYNIPEGAGYTLEAAAAGDNTFYMTGGAPAVDYTTEVKIRFPLIDNAFADDAGTVATADDTFGNANFLVNFVSENEMKITIDDASAAAITGGESTGYFYVLFDGVKVPSGAPSTINVNIEGKAGSAFSDGTVAIASYGSGNVTVAIDDVNTITTTIQSIAKLRIKEDRPGAWESGDTIKMKLPSGFEWQGVGTADVQLYDGDGLATDPTLTTTDDGRTLVITSTYLSQNTASYYTIDDLEINVEDETVAKLGDVKAVLSGTASATPNDMIVAKYGDYQATVAAVGDPLEVIAGRVEQEVGKFVIEESVEGSLSANKSITATLSGGAKWTLVPDFDSSNSENTSEPIVAANDWEIVGSARDQIRLRLGGTASADAVKAVFKGGEIAVSPAATGDIKLTFSGSAGVTGEVIVAKVIKPITMSIEGNPADLIIGAQATELPPIIIAETQAEAIDGENSSTTTTETLKTGLLGPIEVGTVLTGGPPHVVAGDARIGMYYYDSNNDDALTATDQLVSPEDAFVTSSSTSTAYNALNIEFPMDVLPSMPTKVEVIEGDIVIDPNSTMRGVSNDGRWYVGVTIKSTSSTPSKIKYSGIKLTVSRTVPEGVLNAAAKGGSIVQTTGSTLFPGYTSAAAVQVGTIKTPAASEQKVAASFTVGSTTYKINGIDQTMDVAPYIKDGRTFMPLRFVGYGLGVTDQNVIWDDAAKTATLMKGDKVVQVKIGSTTMLVNGVAITMDVAPEIVDGRTMLPLRFVAQAFAATVGWDAATNTATIN